MLQIYNVGYLFFSMCTNLCYIFYLSFFFFSLLNKPPFFFSDFSSGSGAGGAGVGAAAGPGGGTICDGRRKLPAEENGFWPVGPGPGADLGSAKIS